LRFNVKKGILEEALSNFMKRKLGQSDDPEQRKRKGFGDFRVKKASRMVNQSEGETVRQVSEDCERR
jgi:hypothetical protein